MVPYTHHEQLRWSGTHTSSFHHLVSTLYCTLYSQLKCTWEILVQMRTSLILYKCTIDEIRLRVTKFILLYQMVPYTETVCDSPVISFITFTTYSSCCTGPCKAYKTKSFTFWNFFHCHWDIAWERHKRRRGSSLWNSCQLLFQMRFCNMT